MNLNGQETYHLCTQDTIKDYNENSDYGALLEVDIEYPKELATKHRDLPFYL